MFNGIQLGESHDQILRNSRRFQSIGIKYVNAVIVGKQIQQIKIGFFFQYNYLRFENVQKIIFV